MAIYRVRFRSTGWQGGPGLNTFYFHSTVDPTMSDSLGAAAAAARVHAGFAAIQSLYFGVWTGNVLGTVDVLTESTGMLQTSYTVIPGAPIVGQGATDPGPTVTGLLMSLNTADISDGRRVKGRAFLTPMRYFADTDGTPAAAAVAIPLNFGPSLTATSDSIVGVVWRRPRLAVPARGITARAGSAHVITGVSTQDKWTVLRSRRD